MFEQGRAQERTQPTDSGHLPVSKFPLASWGFSKIISKGVEETRYSSEPRPPVLLRLILVELKHWELMSPFARPPQISFYPVLLATPI
jgi:hypothetical protein